MIERTIKVPDGRITEVVFEGLPDLGRWLTQNLPHGKLGPWSSGEDRTYTWATAIKAMREGGGERWAKKAIETAIELDSREDLSAINAHMSVVGCPVIPAVLMGHPLNAFTAEPEAREGVNIWLHGGGLASYSAQHLAQRAQALFTIVRKLQTHQVPVNLRVGVFYGKSGGRSSQGIACYVNLNTDNLGEMAFALCYPAFIRGFLFKILTKKYGYTSLYMGINSKPARESMAPYLTDWHDHDIFFDRLSGYERKLSVEDWYQKHYTKKIDD